MRNSDILLSIFIILIFLFLFSISYMAVGLQKIKDDWPKYRCNPMMMPFAGALGFDTMQNFTFCIGDIQKNMMGFFLNPISFNLGMLGDLGGIITKTLNQFRTMFSGLRGMIGNIVGDIFGIILNVIIQFQKIVTNLKDLIFKIIGTMTILIHLLQGGILTGKSVYNGPIGGTLRTLCFSPKTLLKTRSGKMVQMKDLSLGDILENGSEVIGVLKIKGNESSPYYKIFSDELNDYIYVTGTHKIQDKNTNKFIPVAKCKYAKKTNIFDPEFSCLITDDHLIKIGEHIFWDWED